MKHILLISACGAALMSSTAFAQGAAEPAAAPAVDTNNSEMGIVDIVVTAQRRSERLQDVPIAVTAATAGRLAAVGIQSSQDLSVITPGLTIPQTSGYSQPRLRGVGTSSNGPGVENPVATYIDGVYIASAPSSLLTLNNIERVEVLKGPQGTLFGRNATGGLIQIITKDPAYNPRAAVNLTYGNYETVIADAYVTSGLTDKIAADVAVRYEHQDKGFGTNLFNGQDVGKLDHDFASRMKLLIEPTDATQIRLSFDYESRDSNRDIQHLDINQAPFSPFYLGFGPFPLGGTYDVNQNYQFRNKLKAGGASLQIDQDFGHVALKSITAYRKSRFQFNLDLDLLPIDGFTAASNATFEQFSQEFQLSSQDSGPLKWVAGIYYFHSKDGWQPIDIGIGALVNVNAPGVPFHIIDSNYEKSDAVAGYAQATYSVLPALNLTLGARYNYEHKTVDGAESYTAFGAPAGTVPFPAPGVPTSATFKRFNYRVAVDYKVAPDILGYVSYNTGFKSGGFVLAKIDAQPFKPEDIKAAEVGLKTQFFNRRLRLNVAAFHYDYKNIQVQRFDAGSQLIYNGAKARIRGVDLDGEAVIARGLTINGGLSYIHDRFLSFPQADSNAARPGCPTPPPGGVVACEAAGNKLAQTPTFSYNIGGDYTLDTRIGKIALNATYFHQSKVFAAADNIAFQKPYGLFNASISWTDNSDHMTVRLWGKNLGKTVYTTSLIEGFTGLDVSYGYPRTYGVTAGFKF